MIPYLNCKRINHYFLTFNIPTLCLIPLCTWHLTSPHCQQGAQNGFETVQRTKNTNPENMGGCSLLVEKKIPRKGWPSEICCQKRISGKQFKFSYLNIDRNSSCSRKTFSTELFYGNLGFTRHTDVPRIGGYLFSEWFQNHQIW